MDSIRSTCKYVSESLRYSVSGPSIDGQVTTSSTYDSHGIRLSLSAKVRSWLPGFPKIEFKIQTILKESDKHGLIVASHSERDFARGQKRIYTFFDDGVHVALYSGEVLRNDSRLEYVVPRKSVHSPLSLFYFIGTLAEPRPCSCHVVTSKSIRAMQVKPNRDHFQLFWSDEYEKLPLVVKKHENAPLINEVLVSLKLGLKLKLSLDQSF